MRLRGRRLAWPMAALLLLSGACSSPDPSSAAGFDPESEVAAFLNEYLAAIDARDTDTLGRAYVEDGRFVWIEDGAVRYRSAADILTSLSSFPTDSSIRTELLDLVVVPVGGAGAHAWARFSTTVGSGSGGFSFGGAISFVLEQKDGSWKLVGGHTSAPTGR